MRRQKKYQQGVKVRTEWVPVQSSAILTDTGQVYTGGVTEGQWGRLIDNGVNQQAEDVLIFKPHGLLWNQSLTGLQSPSPTEWTPGPVKVHRFQGSIQMWNPGYNADGSDIPQGAVSSFFCFYMWRRMKMAPEGSGGSGTAYHVTPPPDQRQPAPFGYAIVVGGSGTGEWNRLCRQRDVLSFGVRKIGPAAGVFPSAFYNNGAGDPCCIKVPFPRLGRLGLVLQQDESLVLTVQLGNATAFPGTDDPAVRGLLMGVFARALVSKA